MRGSRSPNSGLWLIALFILLRTLNQVLFKHVALGPGGAQYRALLFEPLFHMACLLFFAQALVWLMVLRRLALTFAYPFTSILFITILFSGALFFQENISLGNVVGSFVIMAGVTVAAGDKQ